MRRWGPGFCVEVRDAGTLVKRFRNVNEAMEYARQFLPGSYYWSLHRVWRWWA